MDLLKSITSAIETFLNANPSCTEHEIIKHLQQNEIEPFGQFNLRVNTDLFSAHFLTKHCLYSLQNSLLQAQRFCLSINSVAVNLTPYNSGLAATMHYDSVKSYYLDISHYFETSESAIDELLGSFWQRFLAQDDKKHALDTLGLSMSADYASVKKAYRTLAQKLHPDKGGDEQAFVKINAAKSLLDQLYR